MLWTTGGRTTPDALEAAHDLLHGPSEDPRRQKVHHLAHRLATGEVTWDEFAKLTKKPLMRRAEPERAAPSPDAIPLGEALARLKAMLAEAGFSTVQPEPAVAWSVFRAFAERPVAATPPHSIESDMCLFQWGAYDWGDGRHFEWNLTRQFAVHDGD